MELPGGLVRKFIGFHLQADSVRHKPFPIAFWKRLVESIMFPDVLALRFGDISRLACVRGNRFAAFTTAAHPHDGLFNGAAWHELDDREAEKRNTDECRYDEKNSSNEIIESIHFALEDLFFITAFAVSTEQGIALMNIKKLIFNAHFASRSS